MSSQPTILIDTNALSHPDLARHVNGKTVYLSDAVVYELFAGGRWEKSISHCLAPLAPFADQVVSTINLGVALRRELETGEPTISIAGDPMVDSRLRRVLLGC